MINMHMNFSEYQKMSRASSNFQKSLSYLKEVLNYVNSESDLTCQCPKCLKIKEINEFVNSNEY